MIIGCIGGCEREKWLVVDGLKINHIFVTYKQMYGFCVFLCFFDNWSFQREIWIFLFIIGISLCMWMGRIFFKIKIVGFYLNKVGMFF